MATNLYYNGVILHNVQTRQFDQETIYDPSHTDQLMQRFRISVEGIVHAQAAFDVAVGSPPYSKLEGEDAPNEIDVLAHQIRSRLAQPRGALRFETLTLDEETQVFNQTRRLLYCVPTNSNTLTDPDRDVDNGPKPVEYSVTQIAGSKLYRIRFTVECSKLECGLSGYGDTLPKVINNRWSIDESMDENFFITRTIRGIFRLSAGSWWDVSTGRPIKSGVSAHALRGLVIPPLEVGFKRESMTFNAAEDGMTATYVVVDRQVHTAAPWPATDMECSHTESTADGANMFSDIIVRLSGPPNADKRLMIQQATQIADAKLNLAQLESPENIEKPTSKIIGAAVTDNIGVENSVELRMRIQRMPEEPYKWLGVAKEKLGKKLALPPLDGKPYDAVTSQSPPLYGFQSQSDVPRSPDAFLLTLSAYLQSPCIGDHQIGQFVPFALASPGESGNAGTVVYQSDHPLPTETGQRYSESTRDAMYTLGRAESVYSLKPLVAQCPIASSVTGNSYDPNANTSVNITLGAPQAQREIIYEAERVGQLPELPQPMAQYQDGNLTGTLLDHKVSVSQALSPEGKAMIFSIRATYVYALNRPPRPEEKIRAGVLPFVNLTPEQTSIAFKSSYTPRLSPGEPVPTP